MKRGGLWVAISMLALTSCGGGGAPPADPASHAPADSDAVSDDSPTEGSEPTAASSSEDVREEWAKSTNAPDEAGADPFPDSVLGFALGMDDAQVRQTCTKAKGKVLDAKPLRCTLDAVLKEVFQGTALWLDAPKKGWLDGGVSVELDDSGHVCGISASLSGSAVGPVVPPSNVIAKLGLPRKLLDARDTRTARWRWPGEEQEAFAGWSHHLPSFQGSSGQRQWVSYCKRKGPDCRVFCSYLK